MATARVRRAFVVAAAVVVALDQLTKHWALNALDDGPIDLVGSLRLHLVFNDSAAFSLGGGNTTVIAMIGVGLSALLVRFGLQVTAVGPAIGFGVLLGGALGNLVDRALRAGDGFLGGRVVDMVDLQWWPVFNLADAALWVGIGILALTWRPDRAADG